MLVGVAQELLEKEVKGCACLLGCTRNLFWVLQVKQHSLA